MVSNTSSTLYFTISFGWAVQFVWLAAISISCMFSGFLFYERSSLKSKGITEDSDLLQLVDRVLGGDGDAFLAGVKRCGTAQVAVMLTYGLCVFFPEKQEMKTSTLKKISVVKDVERLKKKLEKAEERKKRVLGDDDGKKKQ